MQSNSTTAVFTRVGPAQRKVLENKCHNRLNWSDGGHWIGSGKEPNCFIKDEISNTHSHTYLFESDSAATNWNLEHEKAIRYTGHLATAGLTVAATLLTSGMATVAIGTIVAITKDEIQASVDYPRMARGWSFELIFQHSFKWSPHPWGQKGLTQKITLISRDFKGNIVKKSSSSRKYQLSELPDGLARAIATAPSKKTTSNYA
jgi:hypothetical protein